MITEISMSLSNPLLLHLSSPLEEQINPKRKREEEKEEVGCEAPQQTTNIPHSPSSHFQFHPTTPQKSTPYSPNPNLVQRVQGDTWFYCGQQGHWALYCPLKTPNNNTNNKHSTVLSSDKQIWCPCGHGVCVVKIAHTEKKKQWEGKPCGNFKWCDATIHETDLQRSLFTYPKCQCGAGVCKKVMERGKSCFVCPVQQNFGSCGYRVSEVELLNNASTDELVNNTSAANDLTNGLAGGSDLLLTTKRMRITDNSENPSTMAVSEIPEGRSGGSPIEEANSHVGFPEIEYDDDIESINLAIETETYLLSRMPTQSRICCRQSLFERDIVAAGASFGTFPSFDPIDVMKEASTLNSQSECSDLAIKSPNQFTELSTDVVSPKRSPGSESKLKAQIQRDVVMYTQKRLLNGLKKLGFHQHESMRESAEATFLTLNLLGFECKQFSDYVWDFINLSTSMAEIDKSMENSPTLEEQSKLLEEEKARMANIKDECMKTKDLLQASNQKRSLLSEEVAHLEAVLLEKRNKLKFCKLETMKVEAQLDDMKKRMLEVDITFKDKTREVEATRIKTLERDTKQIAARTALENAKCALEK